MNHLRRQLDLFDAARPAAAPPHTPDDHPRLATDTLDDSELVAAIPNSSLRDCDALTGEAACRSLGAAIPALEAVASEGSGWSTLFPSSWQPCGPSPDWVDRKRRPPSPGLSQGQSFKDQG
jgi:hypothetical protein